MLVFKLGIISFSRLFARLLTLPNEGLSLNLMIPSFDGGAGGGFFPGIAGAVLCMAGLWMLWQWLVPEMERRMRMRLYLFELEKLIRKPFYLTAAAGSFIYRHRLAGICGAGGFSCGRSTGCDAYADGAARPACRNAYHHFTAPVFAGEYSLKMEGTAADRCEMDGKNGLWKSRRRTHPFHCPFWDSSGSGLFIHPLCLGKRNLES